MCTGRFNASSRAVGWQSQVRVNWKSLEPGGQALGWLEEWAAEAWNPGVTKGAGEGNGCEVPWGGGWWASAPARKRLGELLVKSWRSMKVKGEKKVRRVLPGQGGSMWKQEGMSSPSRCYTKRLGLHTEPLPAWSFCKVSLLSGMHTPGSVQVTLSAQQEGDLSEGWRGSEALPARGSGHLAAPKASGSPL